MKKSAFLVMMIVLFAFSAGAGPPAGGLLDGVRPGPDGMIDVLTVFAHQDDESIYGGGALLEMVNDPRVRLHILCMTLGDMSEAKDRLGIRPAHLGRIRVKELETAAAVYGAEEVIQFQYHDQGLSSADQERLVSEVLAEIERTGAEVVITHDPLGVTMHPDHVTTSKVATEAFSRSQAQRLYYPTFPGWAYGLITMLEPGPGKLKRLAPSFKVDIRSVKKLKAMAMYAHASQKHFSTVGPAMDIVLLFNHEWFVLAADRP